MQATLALGVALLGAIGFACFACFHWGVWKTRAYVLKLEEAKQREAMEALARPPTDQELATDLGLDDLLRDGGGKS